jgi:hypothetical protein
MQLYPYVDHDSFQVTLKLAGPSKENVNVTIRLLKNNQQLSQQNCSVTGDSVHDQLQKFNQAGSPGRT